MHFAIFDTLGLYRHFSIFIFLYFLFFFLKIVVNIKIIDRRNNYSYAANFAQFQLIPKYG